MNTRRTLTASLVALIGVAVLMAGALSFTLEGAGAQIDPTSEKQTIDAVVADRFTQTAAVQQPVTLTAAFEATVDAAFNQALTATAQPSLKLTAALPGLERLDALNAARISVVGTLPAAVSGVTSLAFSPDGQSVAVVIGQNTLAVVQVATGTFLSTQQGLGDLTAVAFRPDGQALAFSTLGGDVYTLDLASPQAALAFGAITTTGGGEAATLAVNDLAWNPAGLLAVGTSGSLILLWNGSGDPVMFDTGAQGVDALAFSPDGTLLVSGANDGTVALWDVATHTPLQTLPGHTGTITSLAFSPDGTRIASGSADGTARLWNAATGESLATLTVGNAATAVAFSPDGGLLAVGVADRGEDQVILFDGGTYAKVAALSGEAGGVYALAFSPDGAILASGGDTVQLWGVPAVQVVVATATLPPTAEPQTPLPPALAASATPRPAIFPTNVATTLDVAEEAFQHGRMFWLRPNRQVWVMVNNPPGDDSGGDWYCYNDTFVEGEAETDPSLVPPADLYQPRRGFGKLWRNIEGLRDALGWATTPEFELASAYTYIAGGYVDTNGAYVPGPGEHRLTTLYGNSISFFEREIRGDCLGGTWRMTQ